MRARLGCYIRRYRQAAGLTQEELARILGYDRAVAVSRHESLRAVPPLLVAIGYSVVLRKPIAELFPGIFEAVEHAVSQRIAEMQAKSERTAARDSPGSEKKQAWLSQWSDACS